MLVHKKRSVGSGWWSYRGYDLKKSKGGVWEITYSGIGFSSSESTLEKAMALVDENQEKRSKEPLVHITTKEHYESFATITGGEGRAVLRKICLDMIGGDVEALKDAYLSDVHLNNIDEVMRKANTLVTLKNGGKRPPVTVGDVMGLPASKALNSYHQQKKALETEFKHRCFENGINSTNMMRLIQGPYTNDWFLAFDMEAPAFVKATKAGRAKWKEIKGGMYSGGVSNSTICSGLKHVMIFDILGCEFVEEVR